MLKTILTAMAMVGGLMGAAFSLSPAMRARVNTYWSQIGGWTEEARLADPIGFATHAEKKLRQDLQTMQETRKALAGEIGQLAQKLREQRGLANHARTLAREFRSEYQLASADGRFPIEVRGAAYTRPDAESQVSMLLAEADGYDDSVRNLSEVKQQAEAQMEALAVRVNETESQLAALATKRELLRARQLSGEGQQLIAQVDDLLNGNARVIEGNPVRTVRELLEAPVGKVEQSASRKRVQEFLAAGPVIELEEPEVPVSVDQKPGKPEKRNRKAGKPIFQQS
jgi:phage shock protein A